MLTTGVVMITPLMVFSGFGRLTVYFTLSSRKMFDDVSAMVRRQ